MNKKKANLILYKYAKQKEFSIVHRCSTENSSNSASGTESKLLSWYLVGGRQQADYLYLSIGKKKNYPPLRRLSPNKPSDKSEGHLS